MYKLNLVSFRKYINILFIIMLFLYSLFPLSTANSTTIDKFTNLLSKIVIALKVLEVNQKSQELADCTEKDIGFIDVEGKPFLRDYLESLHKAKDSIVLAKSLLTLPSSDSDEEPWSQSEMDLHMVAIEKAHETLTSEKLDDKSIDAKIETLSTIFSRDWLPRERSFGSSISMSAFSTPSGSTASLWSLLWPSSEKQKNTSHALSALSLEIDKVKQNKHDSGQIIKKYANLKANLFKHMTEKKEDMEGAINTAINISKSLLDKIENNSDKDELENFRNSIKSDIPEWTLTKK